MNKPLTVAREDFAKEIIGAVNSSGLPAFVVREVLQSVVKEAQKLEAVQLQADREAWEKAEKTETPEGE